MAGLLTAKYNELSACSVLQSGAYDFEKDVQWELKPKDIKENILAESGGFPDALKERSLIYIAEHIKAPVLLLHGDKDESISVDQAHILDKKLHDLDKHHKTIIYDGGHVDVKGGLRREHIMPFIEKYLLG